MKILRLSFLTLITLAIAGTGVQAKSLPPQLTSVAPPLYFIENQGQIDPAVRFYEQAASHAMYFTRQGVQLNLKGADRSGTIRLSPVDANPSPRLSAEHQRPGTVNYLLGNNKDLWRTDVPTFGAVRYENVYDGIDLKFYGIEKTLEYDVIVKPGASPDTVQLSYDGIQGMRLTASGELEVALENGLLTHQKPYIYQLTGGVKTEIAGHFRIISADRKNGFVYGFEVAEYDQEKTLVIDPVLMFASYLGGTGADRAYGIAVDATENIYIVGESNSADFPVVSAYDATANGWDITVTKLDSTTGSLVWSTYLGGSSTDEGRDIALDSAGNVIVVGNTVSNDMPLLNAYQSSRPVSDPGTVYLAKLNSAGNTLLYATYINGVTNDSANAVAIDSTDKVHVAMTTDSNDLPVLNGYQAYSNVDDIYLAKFDTTVSGAGGLLYATYLGGTGSDAPNDIAICALDNSYLTGYTYSTDFPITPSAPMQTLVNAAVPTAFITKINTNASANASLVYSTFLGGNNTTNGFGIDVNLAGEAYAVGTTSATDFPKTDTSTLNGTRDAFIAKVNSSGTAFAYASYFGGSLGETATAVTVNENGEPYVLGYTTSSNFPLVNPVYNSIVSGNDMTITQFDAASPIISFSTFIGGNGDEVGMAIALDPAWNIYVAGYTSNGGAPLLNQYSDFIGPSLTADMYLAKFSATTLPPLVPDIAIIDATLPDNDLTVNYDAVVTGAFVDSVITIANEGSDYLSIGSIPGSSGLTVPFSFPTETDFCSGMMVMPASSCQFTVRFSPTVAQVYNTTVVIDSNDPDENPVNVALSGFGVGAPNISVPALVDFGTILYSDYINEVQPFDETFSVTNNGGSDLTISSDVLTSGAAYTIWTDNCLNATLPPAGTCDITIRFNPPAPSITYLDAVQITSNDPDQSPISVNITGIAASAPVPVLEVTDSVAPNDDQSIDLGATTVGSPVSEVVTVRNVGMVDSSTTISGVGTLLDPLSLPYTIANDTCTGAAITYNSTCSFNVVFTPTVAGTAFPETFSIVSGVNPITLTVNGSATIAEKAEIVVTDDSGTTNDRIIDFGNLTTGQTATSTLTVTNLGTSGSVLGIYNVAVIDPLSAPFGLITDNCTGQTLAYNSACTMTVEFAPTSVGTFGQMFDIPNSDGDSPDNPVFITVNGNGVAPLVPDITVSDANGLLADTSIIDFGQVAIGSSVSHPVTISSAGGTASLDNLLISSLTTPFAVTSNCPASLVDGSSCTATVTYSPTTAGVDNDSLSISSNDPDEGLIVVTVTGTGTTSNNPPPAPRAIYPIDKSSGLPTALNLRWESVTDTDGDTLTYELYISSNPSFTEELPVLINVSSTTPSAGNILYAGIGGASALLLLCCAPFISQRRRELMVVVACAVLLSCGGASDGQLKSRDGYTNVTINLGGMQQALNVRAQTASPAPEYVNHVVVKVTGPDMDPVLATVQAGSFAVLEVPNGPLRLFDARAFSNSGVEVFYTPTPPYADLDGTPLALALYLNERSNGSYPVSGLLPATTYYWKIVVSDGQTAPVESPVYSFTTQ